MQLVCDGNQYVTRSQRTNSRRGDAMTCAMPQVAVLSQSLPQRNLRLQSRCAARRKTRRTAEDRGTEAGVQLCGCMLT